MDLPTWQASRRRRGRAIVAGAGALLLIATAVVVSLRLSSGSDASSPSSFAALWPESTYTKAKAVQDRIDPSNDSWRLEPEAVATRFAMSVLFLQVSDASQLTDEYVSQRRVHESITELGGRATPDRVPVIVRGARYSIGQSPLIVIVERAIKSGPGGIWSVTSVASPLMSIPLEPGELVHTPGQVSATTSLPDGAAVRFTYAFTGEACGMQRTGAAAAREGHLILQINAPDECVTNGDVSGYIAAYRSVSGRPALDLGSAQEFATDVIPDAAMIPVRFTPAPDGGSSKPTSPPRVHGLTGFGVWPDDTRAEAVAAQVAIDRELPI